MRFLKQKREALAIGKGFFFIHTPVHFSGKQSNIFTVLLRETPESRKFPHNYHSPSRLSPDL